jgi:hypothetical protein
MGAKSVPRKKFVKYLKSLGLEYIRSNDGHDFYDFKEPGKKLLRPVSVDVSYDDVPILHIHTNLKTLGIDKKEFSEKIKNF